MVQPYVRITVHSETPKAMLTRIQDNLRGYTTTHMLDATSKLLIHNTQMFIKTGIGGYHKPPFDTGAMHASVRKYGTLKSSNRGRWKQQVIAVGGVRALGKDVNYAQYVYYGQGPHRGHPRKFTDDATRYSLPAIKELAYREIVDMIARIHMDRY